MAVVVIVEYVQKNETMVKEVIVQNPPFKKPRGKKEKEPRRKKKKTPNRIFPFNESLYKKEKKRTVQTPL